jgi:predicted dinucleotide-binding enzyme
MKVAVLGTGIVGQTLAAQLLALEHDVVVGTRDVEATLARTEPGPMGDPAPATWLEQHPAASFATFVDAAAHGEVVFVATAGMATGTVLERARDHLAGKTVIDVSNPLDFSAGFPPTMAVCNTDSIGEQCQRAHPEAHIVKALNTVTAALMVDPRQVADGDHHVFISGDDAGAKQQVTMILTEWFGWRHVIDLGDISNARGMEMYLPLWVRLFGVLGTGMFNVKVVR